MLENERPQAKVAGYCLNNVSTWLIVSVCQAIVLCNSLLSLIVHDNCGSFHALEYCIALPDSKVNGPNMSPTWSSQGGAHVGPMNLAIWEITDML